MLNDLAVPEKPRILLVEAALEGAAYDEFGRERRERNDPSSDDLPSLIKHLVNIYDRGQHDVWIAKEAKLIQGPNESILSFRARYAECKEHLERLGYTYTPEQHAMRFVAKLRNRALVRVHKPTTVQQAVDIASDLETVPGAASKPLTNSIEGAYQAEKIKAECRNFKNEGTCRYGTKCRFSHADQFKSAKMPKDRDSVDKKLCFTCNQPGHFAAKCPNKGLTMH